MTGGEVAVDATLTDFLARARRQIDAPLAVGFGVRTAEHAAAIGSIADGVIVASQLIRLIESAGSAAAAEAALDALAGDIRGALRA